MTSIMLERKVISNTSPLYYLQQIQSVEVLQHLYGTVYYPEAVRKELEAGARQGLVVPDMTSTEWLKELPLSQKTFLPAMIDLGEGEAEVIASGLENPGSLLILDDQLARRFADLYELSYTGTLGVLIKAKEMGWMPKLGPLLDQLTASGMWISLSLLQTVLRLVGEAT